MLRYSGDGGRNLCGHGRKVEFAGDGPGGPSGPVRGSMPRVGLFETQGMKTYLKRKRNISEAGRRAMALAGKRRWAKARGAAKLGV